MTYEEYALGELYLGPFNGADEGNFMVATGSLIGFIFGNDIWIQNQFFWTYSNYCWTIYFCSCLYWFFANLFTFLFI